MRTGPDFNESHVLADGTTITIRHVRPDDGPAIRRAFDELSPQSRYRRFFHVVPELSPPSIDALTHVDGVHQVVLVATGDAPDLKSERGLGLARYVRLDAEPDVGEPAITVIDAMQSKGIGRLLAIALGDAAHERGIRRFRGEVLASNAPMRAFLAEAGATIVSETGDSIVFDIDLDTPPTARTVSLGRWIQAAADHVVGALRIHEG